MVTVVVVLDVPDVGFGFGGFEASFAHPAKHTAIKAIRPRRDAVLTMSTVLVSALAARPRWPKTIPWFQGSGLEIPAGLLSRQEPVEMVTSSRLARPFEKYQIIQWFHGHSASNSASK